MFNPFSYVYNKFVAPTKKWERTQRELAEYYRIEHVNEYRSRRKGKTL